MNLNLKARVFVRHLGAVGIILCLAAFGADWIFSRMVLGEFDESLLDLAQAEATAALDRPGLPPRIHEKSFGTAPPSFRRLDKFIQVVSWTARQWRAPTRTAQLPAAAAMLGRLRRRSVRDSRRLR
jgi:hypothetical protein